VLKHADDLVHATIDAHRLANGVRAGEERFANGRAQHHDGTRVLLVESADEAASVDRKQRNRLRVLGLGAAHDNFLDATVSTGNQIAIAEEKAARAYRGPDLHVGSSLA